MTLPTDVRIVEVGPRDGLQSEAAILSVQQRIRLIDALSDCGFQTIEAGSFVSPRYVPQMADTADVLAGIRRAPGVRYPVLVPNLTGMSMALAAPVDEVAIFLSATESFSQRNINCSIEQSMQRARDVITLSLSAGIRVRGYVSCALGCPYEGAVPLSSVVHVSERLAEMGCYEISLADTIGVGHPEQARHMIRAVVSAIPVERLAVHFHDTFGRALENVLICLEEGVSVVDSAVGGLGGCPYAPGARGNLATERLVSILDDIGVKTGIDVNRLAEVVKMIGTTLGIECQSKAHENL
jgi:hydroxymethylglutaryl-CoA lyase